MDVQTFLELNMQVVSFFGDSVFIAAATLLLIAYYCYRCGFKKEAAITFLTVVSYPYSLALKGLFKMPRPLNALADFSFSGQYGFPSSHVTYYTVFWGYVIYLAFKLSSISSGLRNTILVIGFYFLILVGVSRVYLGFHFVRDVVGGYTFGGVFLGVLIAVDWYLGNKLEYSLSENKDENN